jgi:hypothetical protein
MTFSQFWFFHEAEFEVVIVVDVPASMNQIIQREAVTKAYSHGEATRDTERRQETAPGS